jgi:hypothetical protein
MRDLALVAERPLPADIVEKVGRTINGERSFLSYWPAKAINNFRAGQYCRHRE